MKTDNDPVASRNCHRRDPPRHNLRRNRHRFTAAGAMLLLSSSSSTVRALSAGARRQSTCAAAFSTRAPPPAGDRIPSRRRRRAAAYPPPRGPATHLSLFSRFSSAFSGSSDRGEDDVMVSGHDPRASLAPLFPSASDYALPPTSFGTDDVRLDLPVGQRVVAFGDVHGDAEALRSFLITAGVLDPASTFDDPVWTGGDTICVQTGDILDRGDDELACLRLLATLSRRATEAGGALYLLYGNHESLNAAGLFQYANPGGNTEFERDVGKEMDDASGSDRWRLQFAGNEPGRWASFEPGGLLADQMLGRMHVGVVLGRTVFVHAGLTAGHVRKSGGIGGMNEQARDWIVKSQHGDNNNIGEYASVDQVIASAQLRAKAAAKTMPDCLGGGSSSPVWMRDYSSPNDAEPDSPNAGAMIGEALKEIGPDVQRMVMGHTPQNRINSALGGRAWRIDVGASRGVMGGTPEVLEIVHRGGKGGEDVVSILTMDGARVDGKERQVLSNVLS